MTLGERIKQLRKELGMTQEKLAEQAGIKRQHLTRIENNITQNPSLETLKNLSSALHCNLFDYLELQTFDTPEEFEKTKEKLLKNTNSSSESITIIHKSSAETQLLSHFKKLNKAGEQKALEQVEMLTKVPEYQLEYAVQTIAKAVQDGHIRIVKKDEE